MQVYHQKAYAPVSNWSEAMKEWTSAGRIDDGERKKSNTPVANRIIMFQVVYRCYFVAIKKIESFTVELKVTQTND